MLSESIFQKLKKFVILFFLSLYLTGCASIFLPTYLQDKNPYTRRFYANYDESLQALNQTLKDLGWESEKAIDPLVYERQHATDLDEQQTLILTKTRQTPMFLGTRYARMNIYLRAKKGISEIEIRYLTTTDLFFRGLKSYRNDSAVNRIITHLEKLLHQKSEKAE